jgi:hypothetical protein
MGTDNNAVKADKADKTSTTLVDHAAAFESRC